MPSSAVRVKPETWATLQRLASEMNEPMQDVVAKAVEAYRRQRILEQANAAYAALRADPTGWQQELEEPQPGRRRSATA